MLFWGFLFCSLVLVAFGRGGFSPSVGMAAAAFGFALFWKAMLFFPNRRERFWLSLGWFALIQAIQLSWMTSIQYMGPLILIVYLFLAFAIGLQFAFLSFFFSQKGISVLSCLAASSAWVFLEWSRTFFFSGFLWNPVGLALTASPLSIQFAALFGVYGLSFWVMFVNLLALSLQKKGKILWGYFALLPYLFGWVHQGWIQAQVPVEKTLSAALVQTALLPEKKDRMRPFDQWVRIFEALPKDQRLDLIILPEASVSSRVYHPMYPIDEVMQTWSEVFGQEALSDLPPLKKPLAKQGNQDFLVTNAFLAQAIANHFHASVIAGFDDREGHLKYNAAFHFSPNFLKPERYEKRVLVPVSEYIPFPQFDSLTQFLDEQFGIGDSFDAGREAKIFSLPVPLGVSICVEETYGEIVRELRSKGARLLVNISNDIWFPRSNLPWHHLLHGQIRAAENGVYVLRSCNSGVTGAIDCFGALIANLPLSEKKIGVLSIQIPLRSFATLYAWWGDRAILFASVLFLILWAWKKKLPLNGFVR